ncbi:flagellar hook assembly protein FlgD [Lacisediminihabitans sp. H27-G8]|uniref:flagellar hook assembly protein FlgD n=1 Tax=Lacisediminihabitans sp. H27-G8 TaxID=3111909 RepID=UPI0038FC5B98
MAIDAITGTVSTAAADAASGIYSGSTTRVPKQTMDSEVFMKLLVTQLRTQDPSAPMDTNQMISQTTQLSMMEKMTELSTTSTEDFSLQMRIAAAAIVGKQVSYSDAAGVSHTGTASSVSFAGSVPQVKIGGVDVALDTISGITSTSA